MKPGGEDAVPLGLARGEIIIGWPEAEGLLDPTLSWKAFRDVVHRSYFQSSSSKHKAASNASSLWVFIREMMPGDYVVVPHGKQEFYAAVIADGPYYHDESSNGRYRRPVLWLNDLRPFSRNQIDPALQHVLGLRRTCQDATFWFTEIEAFLTANGADKADIELLTDLAVITSTQRHEGATTTKTLVDARLGQGQFRSDVLAQWGKACAVTGCCLVEAIRASHLKPWRISTDTERLDPCNGLPLLATLDALFDRGLISFADDGNMLISIRISNKERALLGLPKRLRRALSRSEQEYLRFHRGSIFIA